MQNDEVIFHILRHKHCSFMSKITTGIFCRNPYNLTGICNRSSCPLANSRYATIREDNGVFYLYMKSIERAHTPNKLWERVKLPRNYEQALEIIDKHLMYFPKFLAHKAKQRLTKMTQMRIRMRKLALKTREKIMTTPRKEKKREARREQKAETAAVLEKAIEKELVERLTKGLYGTSIYNLQQNVFDKVLDMDEFNVDKEVEMEDEFEEGVVEYVEGDEIEDDMEDFPGLPGKEIGNAGDDSNEDDDGDEGTVALNRKRSRKDSKYALKKAEKNNSKSKKKAKVIVEVEHEATDLRQRETA